MDTAKRREEKLKQPRFESRHGKKKKTSGQCFTHSIVSHFSKNKKVFDVFDFSSSLKQEALSGDVLFPYLALTLRLPIDAKAKT